MSNESGTGVLLHGSFTHSNAGFKVEHKKIQNRDNLAHHLNMGSDWKPGDSGCTLRQKTMMRSPKTNFPAQTSNIRSDSLGSLSVFGVTVWLLTLFLGSPLELQHHVIMSDKGMDRAVKVERAPQQQTVFPPQLRNHHSDQTAGEGLPTHGSCDVNIIYNIIT